MKRSSSLGIVLALFSLLWLTAGAQDAAQEPAEAVAMVRAIHLSPNAPEVSLTLAGTAEDGAVVAPDEFSALSYQDSTEYVQLPAGEYTATVSAEGAPVLEQTVSFGADTAYTLTALGLVLPGEDAEADEGGDGFFDWLQGLFGGDDDQRDALALRLEVIQDDLDRSLLEGETSLRAVHASPGTEAIDIAFENERGSLIGGLSYGEASRYVTTELLEGEGHLVVRIAGSSAVALDLSDVGLEPGTVNTILVTGTSLEDAPLSAIVLSNPATVEAAPEDAAAPAPAAPAGDAADEADAATLQTVLDIVAANPELSTLTELLGQAGMTDLLASEGPFTVLAPTDDAFAALPAEQFDALAADPALLEEVLSLHLVEGAVFSSDLAVGSSLSTLQGAELVVADDGSLSGANIVEADLEASNGVVHMTDAVLLPESMVEGN